MSVHHSITQNDLTLEYRIYKGGSDILLAFHGYGRNADDMEFFHPHLMKQYTIYAFNFFHHGGSVYPDERICANTLRVKEWNDLVNCFLVKENISRFDLFGYSMGGKICLGMIPAFEKSIQRVWLLAPDGLKENFWYALTSRNRVGTSMYRKIIENPEPLFKTMHVLTGSKLLNPKLARFARSNLDTREKRQQVYRVWMTLRNFKPDLKRIGKCIRENKIRVHLYFGKYDRIIPAKLGKRLQHYCPENCTIAVLDCGHNLLTPYVAEAITV